MTGSIKMELANIRSALLQVFDGHVIVDFNNEFLCASI